MNKNYKDIQKEYLNISSQTRSKLTALCLALIAGIYFFYDRESVNTCQLNISLIFLLLTMFIEVIAGFLKSEHYGLWFEKKIDDIDYRNSIYGRVADNLFWFPLITFLLGTFLFFLAIN